jgi:[histone H3]-lysine36 N-dimethyltransferase SETMAR
VEKRNGQLLSVLWGVRGIIFIDYLEKSQTINSKYHMALLKRLDDEIKKKTAPSSKHCTVSQINQNDATAKLHELGYKLLPHPLYSPDLAPSNFFCFKRMLAGKKFSINESSKITSILRLFRNRTIKMPNCYVRYF